MALTQPKRPVGGAFGVFSNENRAEFMKSCQGQRASEVSKLAGAGWKNLSDKEKEPYQKKYVEAKAKFDVDMAAFIANGGEKTKGMMALRREKKKAKEGKKSKDANAPKKPAGGGYGAFLAENRAEIVKSLPVGHKMTDVAKAAGGKWKALSDAAKKPYEDKYQEKMAAFKVAEEEYKQSDAYEAFKESNANKAKQTVLETPEKKQPRGAKRTSPPKPEGQARPAKVGRKLVAGRKSVAASKSLLTEGVLGKCALMGTAESGVSYKGLLEKLLATEGFANVDQDKALEALKQHGGLLNKTRTALLAVVGA